MLRLFTKSNIYCSLKYPQKQKTYEADVTVVDTDATIFAECKAKILVTASLNGNIHAIKDDIYKAIGKAYEQAIRTIKHVHAGKTFYNPKDDKELLIQCTPTNYILCVNIEHFGFVPSEIKKYITIDRTIPIVPIAINIYDLDVITQECKCAEEFLQYLDFRVKNADSLMSLDELESFGYFRRFGNVMIPLEGAGTLLPLGLMEEIDGKFMPIASKTVLSKSTEYAP